VLVEYAAASNALRCNSDKVDHERGIKWLHAMYAIEKRAKQGDSFIACLVDEFSTFRAYGISSKRVCFRWNSRTGRKSLSGSERDSFDSKH